MQKTPARYLFVIILLVALTSLMMLRADPTQADLSSSDLEFLAAKLAATSETQAGSACQQIIYNGSLDQGYGWDIHFPVVQVEETIGLPHTAPSAFRMVEDSDGYKPPFSGDSDGFGQTFSYPNQGMTSAVIEYRVRYLSLGSSDGLRHALFEVDANGALTGLPVYEATAPSFLDGQWHLITDTLPYSPSVQGVLAGKQAALVFYTETDDSPLYLDVLIDDIQFKICNGSTPPSGSISGIVSQNSGSVTGANIQLNMVSPGIGGQIIDEVATGANGLYQFRNVPGLAAGSTYQVHFANDDASPERLSSWNGSIISSFPDGHADSDNSFDITNIQLISPTHEATGAFPVRFTWTGRGNPGEVYDLCVANPQTLAETCPQTDLTQTEATIVESDFNPGFGLQYGERYTWFIRVREAGSSTTADSGESFYANAITFAANQPAPPPANGPPPSGSPPQGGGLADWTVMFYIAGDNNLGDPRRYLDPTLNLQGQFASLKQLAGGYQNVNLVTLTDFYDDSGTLYCHLKPGSQDCQQLGELDTSDPLVLSAFISDTLSEFPANHTMLVISDHGHSIAGVAADETTGPTAVMMPSELRSAYESANLAANKLDVLFYNACLMGSMEAAYDASGFADYLIATADELWVLNVYDRLLPLLANPGTKNDPAAVASGIVQAYKQAVEEVAPGYFISSAAYDLAQVPAVNTALSNLAAVLADELPTNLDGLVSVRDDVQVYDSSGDFELGSEDAFVDLGDFASRLAASPSVSATINLSATVLSNTLASFVIDDVHISGENGQGTAHDLSGATGLSLYFPNGEITGEQPTLTNLYLNTGIYQDYLDHTEWDEFLRLYISGALSSGPGRLESATRPVSGAFPFSGKLFLPVIMSLD